MTPAIASRAAVPAEAPPRFGAAFTALCVLVFVLFARPQDYVEALWPLRVALLSTIVTVVLTMFSAGPTLADLFSARETKLYFLFYAVMVAGIPFSYYRPGTFETVITQYPINLAFFLLLIFHVDSVPKLKRIGVVLGISAAVFTVLALSMGEFAGGRFFLRTHMFDPNDMAYVVLSLIAFALWILVGSFGLLMKALALVSVLGGILLTLFTASRGGLLGLLTFFVLFLCVGVKKVGKPVKLALAVAITIAAIANSDKINTERYLTLTSIEDDYNFEEGGRADLWKRGWRLFLQHPLTGVGVNGFAPAVGWQRVADKAATLRWQVAHSAYITVMTETGVIGSLAFLLLMLRCIVTFNRLRRPSASLDPDLAALPGLLLIGFLAQLVAAMFLSQAYSIYFTLAFALSGALNRMTAAAKPVAVPVSNTPPSWPVRRQQTMTTGAAWNAR